MEEADDDSCVVSTGECFCALLEVFPPSFPRGKRFIKFINPFMDHMINTNGQWQWKASRHHHGLTFKLDKDALPLLRNILEAHGFTEIRNDNNHFNIYWMLSRPSLAVVSSLKHFQRINHFLNGNQLTLKHKLYKNIQRMQHSKGFRNFNIIPKTFMIPNEISLFQEYYRKFKGVWIVKPCGLSRGRGIYLIDHINQLNKTTGSSLVISQYIQPFCINGFKFDLRLYVAVTSYDPLRIYLFKEGLGRFAAEPYHKDDISNLCIHLTNYSINKYNPNFVSSDDGEREDCGNKWSLSAIFRYLKKQGHNVEKLLMSIEDIVIKTIISAEHHIADPVKNPHNDRCFELFGFDIMLDKSLQPWLLEVNLSPSLTCDSPLDTKIKSNLITDLLSLVGLPLYDPCTGKPFHGSVLSEVSSCQASATDSSLSHKDVLMINQTRDEYKRRRNFVRIFPSIDSWELYGCFLEHRTKRNYLLHSQLYPCQSCKIKWPPRPATPIGVVISRRLKRAELIKPHYSITVDDEDESDSRGLCATQRVTVYLKQLTEHDHGSDIVLGKYDGCVANGLNDGDVMTDDCCVNEIPLHSLMKKSKSCTCVVTSNDIITSDDDDSGRDISSTNHLFRSNSVCS